MEVMCNTKGLNATEWSNADMIAGQRMHLATNGAPSAIKDLVVDACLIAAKQGDDMIRLSHFSEAYERVRENIDAHNAIRSAQGDSAPVTGVKNPFTAKIQSVQSELFKKAA